MKIITYYQFMQWDGGDRHMRKDPCFFTKEEADLFLGDNKYDHFEERTVHIYDSVEEYKKVSLDETKNAALAKLTDIEKKALGLI